MGSVEDSRNRGGSVEDSRGSGVGRAVTGNAGFSKEYCVRVSNVLLAV